MQQDVGHTYTTTAAALKRASANVKDLPKTTPQIDGLLAKLRLSADTRASFKAHLDLVGLDVQAFTVSKEDQDAAFLLLNEMDVDIPRTITRDARSKLSIVNTNSNHVDSRDKKVRYTRHRRIFQCQCGTDHREGNQGGERRDIPWKNVGCGFWVRLTTTHDERDPTNPQLLVIHEIVGDLTHSADCLSLDEMDQNPRIPLNPELRAYALGLVRAHLPLPQLKQQCRQWAHSKWGIVSGDEHHRYVLNDRESSSLYRTLAREQGIRQRVPAQDNLDKWFRAENPLPPDPRLTAARISYTPCVEGESDRFRLIISTPEQKKLAWRYGHNRQGIMDLTFGFCSGRALLPILMVLDENKKGLPIAFFIFTAKKEAKAVHADYNSELITELLEEFKVGMGTNEAGETFNLHCAITDNDPRERTGLQYNWEAIILLLCMFHSWQAWRNALNKHLRVVPKGEPREEVRGRLASLLMKLMKQVDVFEDAVGMYNAELAYFNSLARKRDEFSKLQAKGGLAFLTYFRSYLKLRDFWRSWSIKGAMEAAERMDVPVSEITRTTNHLESFNGHIKNDYFEPYTHSGCLPRMDIWVLVLIVKVMPNFFMQWAEKRERKEYYTLMRKAKSSLPEIPTNPSPRTSLFDVPKSVEEARSIASAWAEEVFARTTATPNTFDPEQELERELMEQVMGDASKEDSEENEGDVDPELEEEYGVPLTVDSRGDFSWRQPADTLMTDSDSTTSFANPLSPDSSAYVSIPDLALDSSQIVADLAMTPEFSRPQSAASSCSDIDLSRIMDTALELSKMPSVDDTPDLDPGLSNRRATAMFNLLHAEDTVVKHLRELTSLGVDISQLEDHISPNIAERLLGRAPEPIASDISLAAAPHAVPHTRNPSVSGPIALPNVPTTGVRRQLLGFEIQRKEGRKPSHGVR
ncbi:hypothetical protein DFH06DRAFT_1328908 [Mycena polygramma]|nr:hypothetical protein DFH06DRAFT_1328908 [Mycena polygramma]